MPRQPQWFQHIPAALRTLRDFPAPVVDRAALEKLLHISRRDAIRLLHRFGGLQAGKTFLIGRDELAHALETIAAGEPYGFEARRRARVADVVVRAAEETKARAVRLDLRVPVTGRLPEAVRLGRGELHVTFTTAEELLGHLYGIVQVAMGDFDAFKATVDAS